MAGFRGRSPSPLGGGEYRSRRGNGFVRRCERCCTATLRCFPLALVYGLTTWAIYTQVRTCLVIRSAGDSAWIGNAMLALSLALYTLLNWCYTVAVFTDPGSPLNPASSSTSSRHAYSHLPTVEPPRSTERDTASLAGSTITVKSTGAMRFCKKCQTKKPDRAHHCSTCGRCVLKMDHHCPWLATCVGLRNYKAFLLFCAYVTVFCWVCFLTSAGFIWGEISTTDMSQRGDLFSVNVIMLAVIAGVFGLVLTGFTGWHLSLAVRNQTTIECLEKTRYLNPIRRTMDRATHAFPPGPGVSASDEPSAAGLMQHYGHQLAEMHANAIPGVTRAEEGEERASPSVGGDDFAENEPLTAAQALRMNYAENERARERARYDEYLEEEESAKLPHAFDLGWRRNLKDLFGADWRLWLLPVCNTAGDGWQWESSARWTAAQRDLQRQRDARARDQEAREVAAGWGRSGSHGAQSPYRPGAEVPMRNMARDEDDGAEDTASTDGLYARDGERTPRASRDEWRDWE